MLIHERFIFLHFQKTAGTYVADALMRELPAGSLTRGAPHKLHPGWRDIPPEATDKPALMFIRNPWDWYASWYHFVRAREPDNVIFRRLFANGGADFATVVSAACHRPDATGDPELARLAATGDPLSRHFAAGHDFYTASFLAFTADGLDSDRLTIGRFESLVDDLHGFLRRVGISLDDAAMERLRSGDPLKVTPHPPYRELYDAALCDLVGSSCRAMVDSFGYAF